MAAPLSGGDEVNAIVLDIGSYQCKAGYAGEDSPKVLFNSVIVEPVDGNSAAAPLRAGDEKRSDSGAQPSWKRRSLQVAHSPHLRPSRPVEVHPAIQDGAVADWDYWKAITHEALVSRMRTNPEEHPLLCAEPSNVPASTRETVVQALFEDFSSPAVFLAKNAVLSSFSLGRQTSVVLDIGYSGTTAVAVQDGYVLNGSIVSSPVGGRILDECMLSSLASKGTHILPWYNFTAGRASLVAASAPVEASASHARWSTSCLIADIKESHCRVSETPFVEEDNVNMPVQTYELPDGTNVSVGPERFKIPEVLFNPHVLSTIEGARGLLRGKPATGVSEMVIQSVGQTDVDVRKEMYGGVVLTGGCSLFNSAKERLDKELLELAHQMARVRVMTHQNVTERKFSVWLGGSILGCLGSFHQLWMSKQEYDEHGPSLIHRKSP